MRRERVNRWLRHRATGTRTVILMSLLAVAAGRPALADTIERAFINPAAGYTQVVTVSANGVTTVYVSGQVSPADSLEAQLRGAFASLRDQLAAAGAKLTDIVKLNTYIVDYKTEHLELFKSVRDEFFPKENRPASTLVGVAALALPEYSVEIEATAVIASE